MMGERLLAPAPALVPRAVPRRKTFELVGLQLDAVCHRAHMLNLSAGGACVHARCTLRVWQTVTVTVRGRVLPGRISWIAGDRCGVRFTTALSAAEVDAIAG